ncbi:hypothetical protein TVAG_377760 [Trichomonas vaginalis G3]|uniref:Uncharacterized protein n=1 Tax=Trichomonas vaginalis (strain ATCC PRA-98 / G3) TaxID=412133 RepID=A2DAW7_TRIV3|nr:hypothetical protein TVAG_377760 [Trichomonas vaginalis G3]|eukprot:XP_001583283.1 hypothetical protein [Trichomonas vaginalis G3]
MFLFSLTFTSLTSSIHNDVKSPLEIYRNSLNDESTSVFSIEYGPQIEEENVTQGGEVSIKTTYKLSVETPKYKIRVTLGDKSVEKELEKTETEKNITINITIPDNTSVGNFTFNVSVVIANTPEEVTNHSVYVKGAPVCTFI